MNPTPYELADLSQAYFGNSISAYAVFLSIVSGFLVTAYVAGPKLTRFQVRLLTTLFSLVVFFLVWTMAAYTYWGVLFAMGANAENDSTATVLFPSYWVPIVFAALNLITAAMCLVFMWNVRHPKSPEPEPRSPGILEPAASAAGEPDLTKARSAELAVGWIEAWKRMDMAWLEERLAPDFVHTSPFGRLEGRDLYLETVAPMAQKSVQELEVTDVIASGDQAAVWFENRTAEGAVPSCDWVRVENGRIQEIQSFYDSAKVREVLSPDEQGSLGGYGKEVL